MTTAAGVFNEPLGQGWAQIGLLGLAFVLSAVIGLEREIRQKSAGLRTHTIVGLAAALIMLVSKYGFTDVLGAHVVLDPSRVAAQIVSGIGFIGGGVIFVRRDAVRGLTTAAVVWLTAAVGMAAGADLPVLAVCVTAGHFLVVFGFTPMAGRLLRSKYAPSQLIVTYGDGQGVLRTVLTLCTERGFTISGLSTQAEDKPWPAAALDGGGRNGVDGEALDGRGGTATALRVTSVILEIHGTQSLNELAAALSERDGVISVSVRDEDMSAE
jgi:putative Mg2+ transporter-C (MgtC) family protein